LDGSRTLRRGDVLRDFGQTSHHVSNAYLVLPAVLLTVRQLPCQGLLFLRDVAPCDRACDSRRVKDTCLYGRHSLRGSPKEDMPRGRLEEEDMGAHPSDQEVPAPPTPRTSARSGSARPYCAKSSRIPSVPGRNVVGLGFAEASWQDACHGKPASVSRTPGAPA